MNNTENNKCLRCGEVAEVETERGFLCNSCECLRLECLNNPYQEMDINDFWELKGGLK